MSKLGPFMTFIALEEARQPGRRIDAERREMYRRPDAQPLPDLPEQPRERRLRLPSFLLRRRAGYARD